jgi:ABC-2 type transport system permease protein
MTTSFLFLMPLTFSSNIFVEMSTMPRWLQVVVGHNPVTLLATASRALMHGRDAAADILWVLVASAAIVAVAAPVAMRMYRKER